MAKIECEGGDYYIGDVVGIDTFHGYGEYYYNSGTVYKGNFKNGGFNGRKKSKCR